MKRSACSRAWQAEALEDGRLSAGDAAAFERHAATCKVCAYEIAALDVLRGVGRQLPALESSPLARRRQRNELLRRANEAALHGPGVRWPRMLAVSATVLACLAALLVLRTLTPTPVAVSRPDVPTYRLVSSEGAVFRTLERAATLRLALDRGHLEIDVDKLHAGQRFLLRLPDGELEVQGTRFTVDVTGTRTQRVAVSEGRVVLRLRAQTVRVLSAGDAWPDKPGSSSAPRSASGDARAPDHAAAAPTDQAPAAEEPERCARAAVSASTADEGAPSKRRVIAARDTSAGAAFAVAMAAFAAGDNEGAERLFLAFEQRHPRDARVEDALFLRAVAQLRRGDTEASRALARRYLERHPHGLRRHEVERLAR